MISIKLTSLVPCCCTYICTPWGYVLGKVLYAVTVPGRSQYAKASKAIHNCLGLSGASARMQLGIHRRRHAGYIPKDQKPSWLTLYPEHTLPAHPSPYRRTTCSSRVTPSSPCCLADHPSHGQSPSLRLVAFSSAHRRGVMHTPLCFP